MTVKKYPHTPGHDPAEVASLVAFLTALAGTFVLAALVTKFMPWS
jgi:hypothetical protein